MNGVAQLPEFGGSTKLVACMVCSLIKDIQQFEEEGCDNCERVLRLKGQRDAVYLYTSESFEGLIALVEPRDSWVAKWQHLSNMKKGLYAVSVKGVLPPAIRQDLSNAGVGYRNRDKDKFGSGSIQITVDEDEEMRYGRRRPKQRRRRKKRAAKSVVSANGVGGSSSTPDLVEDEENGSGWGSPSLTIIHGEVEGRLSELSDDEEEAVGNEAVAERMVKVEPEGDY